jgi:hypothetical protein
MFFQDAGFKYRFLTRFSAALTLRDISLRPSFVRTVVRMERDLRLQGLLFKVLLGDTACHPPKRNSNSTDGSSGGTMLDESVLDHAFLQHANRSTSEPDDGLRLLVITNVAFYLSIKTFDYDQVYRIKAAAWNVPSTYDYMEESASGTSDASENESKQRRRGKLLDCMAELKLVAPFKRFLFSDINAMYLDSTKQMFGVERFRKSSRTRLTKAHVSKVLDVFVHPHLGVAQRLLAALSSSYRDDLNQPLPVLDTDFTLHAAAAVFKRVMTSGNARFRPGPLGRYKSKVRLASFCQVLRGGKRRACLNSTVEYAGYVGTLLLWMQDGAKNYLVTADYNMQAWQPEMCLRAARKEFDAFISDGKTSAAFAVATMNSKAGLATGATSAPHHNANSAAAASSSSSARSRRDSGVSFQKVASERFSTFLASQTPKVYDLAAVSTLDFSEDSDDILMQIVFKTRALQVRFENDTAREIWRRHLQDFLFSVDRDQWKQLYLPSFGTGSAAMPKIV